MAAVAFPPRRGPTIAALVEIDTHTTSGDDVPPSYLNAVTHWWDASQIYGSDIERASGSGGERYADLDNAFVYRRHIVNACTCNGKDAFGLARLEAGADPTLQAGDVVATDSGLVAVTRQRRGAAQTRASAPTPPKLANRGSD